MDFNRKWIANSNPIFPLYLLNTVIMKDKYKDCPTQKLISNDVKVANWAYVLFILIVIAWILIK